MYQNITNTPNLLTSLNITNFTINEVKSGIWPGNASEFQELRNLTFPFFNFTLLNETFNDTLVLQNGAYIAQKLFNADFAGIISSKFYIAIFVLDITHDLPVSISPDSKSNTLLSYDSPFPFHLQ